MLLSRCYGLDKSLEKCFSTLTFGGLCFCLASMFALDLLCLTAWPLFSVLPATLIVTGQAKTTPERGRKASASLS